jgi:integrase
VFGAAVQVNHDQTGLHAVHHFYASLLIRHGESVKTVQKRLGHSSAAITLDTYTSGRMPTTGPGMLFSKRWARRWTMLRTTRGQLSGLHDENPGQKG